MVVEPLEHGVIRILSTELSQANVDRAFYQTRLTAIRDTLTAMIEQQHEMLAHLETQPSLPPGMALVPADLFGRLGALLR